MGHLATLGVVDAAVAAVVIDKPHFFSFFPLNIKDGQNDVCIDNTCHTESGKGHVLI